jgi:hypothetical protein
VGEVRNLSSLWRVRQVTTLQALPSATTCPSEQLLRAALGFLSPLFSCSIVRFVADLIHCFQHHLPQRPFSKCARRDTGRQPRGSCRYRCEGHATQNKQCNSCSKHRPVPLWNQREPGSPRLALPALPICNTVDNEACVMGIVLSRSLLLCAYVLRASFGSFFKS